MAVHALIVVRGIYCAWKIGNITKRHCLAISGLVENRAQDLVLGFSVSQANAVCKLS